MNIIPQKIVDERSKDPYELKSTPTPPPPQKKTLKKLI